MAGSAPLASAAGNDLGVSSTSLGNIVVDGKGMTAYYFDNDQVNSGVSACTGGCSAHWPAITSTSATPVVSEITGKITVIAGTNQIVINGRPIYTFAGDQKAGDTNGQGVGGIWYVISPSGVELTPAEIAKAKSAPAANPSPIAASGPSKSKIKSPVVKLVAHATGAQVLATDNSNKGGSPTGSAEATFRLDTKTNRLCYSVSLSLLPGVIAAHIHSGAKGVDGGVVVPLNPAKFNKGTTCISVAPTLMADITNNPALYYVNFHTKAYSAGAIRGQLAASK